MEDERLLSAFAVGEAFCAAVPLPEASPAHQLGGKFGVLAFLHIPGHHHATPVVDQQVEIQPNPFATRG